MTYVITLLTIVSLFGPSLSQAASCKQRIYFLPQSHATEYASQLTIKQINQIVSSQLKVAKFIDGFTHAPVFTEQAGKNDYSLLGLSNYQIRELNKLMKETFPNGFPENANLLSEFQQQKLYKNGGDFIQLMFGKINTLRGVIGNETKADEIFKPIDKWFNTTKPKNGDSAPLEIKALIYGEREREALRVIKKFFANNPEQKNAILIFGANHNFKFYPELFPPQCIHVPTEFLPDWTGINRTGPNGFHTEAEAEARQNVQFAPGSAIQ